MDTDHYSLSETFIVTSNTTGKYWSIVIRFFILIFDTSVLSNDYNGIVAKCSKTNFGAKFLPVKVLKNLGLLFYHNILIYVPR